MPIPYPYARIRRQACFTLNKVKVCQYQLHPKMCFISAQMCKRQSWKLFCLPLCGYNFFVCGNKCEHEIMQREWVTIVVVFLFFGIMYEFKSNYMMDFRLLYCYLLHFQQIRNHKDEWHESTCDYSIFQSFCYIVLHCSSIRVALNDDDYRLKQRQTKEMQTNIFSTSTFGFLTSIFIDIAFKIFLYVFMFGTFATPPRPPFSGCLRTHTNCKMVASILNDHTYWWHCFS